nr:inactive glutathione s-transferase d3 [Quercus suber]
MPIRSPEISLSYTIRAKRCSLNESNNLVALGHDSFYCASISRFQTLFAAKSHPGYKDVQRGRLREIVGGYGENAAVASVLKFDMRTRDPSNLRRSALGLNRYVEKSPAFTKINVMATVPAAVDGDLTLTESDAILQYAADITEGGDKFYPKDVKRRAIVNRWLLWEASVWFPSNYTYLVEYVVKPLLQSEPDQKVIDDAAPRYHQLARVLNDQLGQTPYVADELSIADIAIAACMHLHQAMRVPLTEYPNICRWYADIEKLAAWQNTQAAVEKALLPGKE